MLTMNVFGNRNRTDSKPVAISKDINQSSFNKLGSVCPVLAIQKSPRAEGRVDTYKFKAMC